MKKLFFFGLIIGFFAMSFSFDSCLPKTKQPTPVAASDSTWWVVDTSEYYTYQTFASGSSGTVIFSGSSANASAANSSSFSFTFHLPYVPAHGDYALNCGSTNSSAVCAEITYKGISYRPNPQQSGLLHADSFQRKAVINLPLTWFYSTLLPAQDSIAVTGVFYQ